MIHISYNSSNELDGIFTYLYNTSKSEFISVIGTKLPGLSVVKEPIFVTKRNQPIEYFWASDSLDEYITFSFPFPVLLESYTLANAGSWMCEHSYPTEWSVLGSNDMIKWKEISHPTGIKFCSTVQCLESKPKHFEVSLQRYFRHIRIENIANSRYSDDYLILRSVELFGILNFFGNTKNKFISVYIHIFLVIFTIKE